MNSLYVLDIIFESCICFSSFPSLILTLFWWSVSLSFCDCTQGQPGRKTWDYRSSHSVPGWPAARLRWEQSSFSSAHCSPWELFPVETRVLSIVRAPHFLFSSYLLSMSLLNLYPPWANFLAVESPLPTFGVLCPVLLLFCVNEWDWGSPPSRMSSGLKHSCDPLSNSDVCFQWDRYPEEIVLSERE